MRRLFAVSWKSSRAVRILSRSRGRWIAVAASASLRREPQRGRAASQHVVGAVAIGPVVGALAAAQVEGAGRLGDETVRLEARRLVRAVAERLLRRAPTNAPGIGFARLQRHLIRPLLGADRLVGHGGQTTLSLCFSETLAPLSSVQVNSNSPGPGTRM